MLPSLSETRYKDLPAVSISSDLISAAFLPTQGAKLASLIHKPSGRELMVQRPGVTYKLQPYGGSYVAGECSGMDDMLPTIDECHYERAPWQGTLMPDHGEVWALPWTWEIEPARLHCATYGVRFPYRIEKWAALSRPDCLRVDYRLTNLSPFAFDFLWAAHAMFNLEEGTELVLPQGVNRVTAVFTLNGCMGRYGQEFDWPAFQLPDGSQRDLRWLRPKSTRQCDKYFVSGRLPAGWCELRYHQSDITLRMEWPVEQVPYLGILPNEGAWDELYNIFLEPCTAPFDRPDAARLHKALSGVAPHSTYEWYLELSLTSGVLP